MEVQDQTSQGIDLALGGTDTHAGAAGTAHDETQQEEIEGVLLQNVDHYGQGDFEILDAQT